MSTRRFNPSPATSPLVIVDTPLFTNVITALIIFNAIILGMETYPKLMATYGPTIKTLDHIMLWVFMTELMLRLGLKKGQFFKDPWSIFDLIVVGIAFFPSHEVFAVLRATRVLRVLRLISIFPRLRRVAESLIQAIPGIASIGAILLIIMYVSAVMATKLYGEDFPQWFGSLQSSVFSLFQIMALEGWPDIARTVMHVYPQAWIFFILYILIATFSTLNLFIAIIVDAVQKHEEAEKSSEQQTLARIEAKLQELSQSMEKIKG